jgi:hypothetical protein
MGLTYGTSHEANADRLLMRELLKALDGQSRTLHRDECGAWRVTGKSGHIYSWESSDGWLISCAPGTARKWRNLKSRLSFCEVMQDGDDEGCFRLVALPTAEQAIQIRKALGLKRKRQVNPTLLLDRFQTPTGRPVPGSGMRADGRAGREGSRRTRSRVLARERGDRRCRNERAGTAGASLAPRVQNAIRLCVERYLHLEVPPRFLLPHTRRCRRRRCGCSAHQPRCLQSARQRRCTGAGRDRRPRRCCPSGFCR